MPSGWPTCSSRVPQMKGAEAVHAELDRRDRQLRLMRFRSGETPVITAVDILNEGVDVPDVNIICFARVTHSRRIFVQQLGRGLRLREGKSHVETLDFVSDIRRVAAVLNLREQVAADEIETLRLSGNPIRVHRPQGREPDARVDQRRRESRNGARRGPPPIPGSRYLRRIADEPASKRSSSAKVIAEIYRRADDLDWDGLSPSDRSTWYVRWLDDPAIGGVLDLYMPRDQARHVDQGRADEALRPGAERHRAVRGPGRQPSARCGPANPARHSVPDWAPMEGTLKDKPNRCTSATATTGGADALGAAAGVPVSRLGQPQCGGRRPADAGHGRRHPPG